MKDLISDVRSASAVSKVEAKRELAVTLIISLATFFIGPLIFSMLVLPAASGLSGAIKAFTGADIYIAAVSLLSISIYSTAKAYDANGRDKFSFPHATTILSSAVIIILVAGAVYTSRIIYEALPTVLSWRVSVAALLGWIVFGTASAFAYAVLVLRNDLESGASQRTRDDTLNFVAQFQAAQHDAVGG